MSVLQVLPSVPAVSPVLHHMLPLAAAPPSPQDMWKPANQPCMNNKCRHHLTICSRGDTETQPLGVQHSLLGRIHTQLVPLATQASRPGKRKACHLTHLSAFQPVNGSGRKMPPRHTVSPAFMERVMSPLKCTLMVRGVAPEGTSSGISCRRHGIHENSQYF